jgi:hypothetical protein
MIKNCRRLWYRIKEEPMEFVCLLPYMPLYLGIVLFEKIYEGMNKYINVKYGERIVRLAVGYPRFFHLLRWVPSLFILSVIIWILIQFTPLDMPWPIIFALFPWLIIHFVGQSLISSPLIERMICPRCLTGRLQVVIENIPAIPYCGSYEYYRCEKCGWCSEGHFLDC